ncbi:MAG: hypothetical protein EAX86_11015 [Candidatus Heimdallarchaeota archaeon]|nr:hypothetical protein [Candidatus Heimdallarchaeota archaeon]
MLETYKEYLIQSLIPLRLSGTTNTGWPFIVSLWYVYLDEKIYLATVKSAKVIKYLFYNPKCAFEIASDTPPYCGVRGQAKAKIIESKGDEILKILLNRYLGGIENSLARNLMNRRVSEVAIELSPLNVFQWNYSDRMQEIVETLVKICP